MDNRSNHTALLVRRVRVIAVALPLIGAVSTAHADQIGRDYFDAVPSVGFDFGSSDFPTLTNGFLTTSDAVVRDQGSASIGVEWGPFAGGNAIGSSIRFDFSAPVYAFGVDFIANDTCSRRFYDLYADECTAGLVDRVSFTVFGNIGGDDVLINSVDFGLTLGDGIEFLVPGEEGAPADFPYGFAGWATTSPIITAAEFTSDLPIDMLPLRVDNAVYQLETVDSLGVAALGLNGAAVPAPTTFALFGLALAGLGFARRWQPRLARCRVAG